MPIHKEKSVMIPRHNTSWENKGRLWIKHEEECAPPGAPPFSKLRGVYAHIAKQKEGLIAVLDTQHSKAGWAVAWCAKELNKTVINYYPCGLQEGFTPESLRSSQVEAVKLGAKAVPIKPGRSAILYNSIKKSLPPDTYLMPNALKLYETVEETANEVERHTPPHLLASGVAWVISISSGTIAAGVIRGLNHMKADVDVFLHCGYSRSEKAVRLFVHKMSGVDWPEKHLRVIDEGYNYSDMARTDRGVDFLCNPYYDLKAYLWVMRDLWNDWNGPIVFWNVGG